MTGTMTSCMEEAVSGEGIVSVPGLCTEKSNTEQTDVTWMR